MESESGRLTFDSFEPAVDELRLSVANITTARDFVASRDFESFYHPPSRTYIAVIPRGGVRPTAWINKGFMWFRNDDGTQDGIAFPENKLRDGGRNSRQHRREEAENRICPTPGCGMVLPANGACE